MQAPLTRSRVSFTQAIGILATSLLIGVPLLILIFALDRLTAPDAFHDPL